MNNYNQNDGSGAFSRMANEVTVLGTLHSDTQRVRKKVVYAICPTPYIVRNTDIVRGVIGWEALRGLEVKE